jgi:hypothetical protein
VILLSSQSTWAETKAASAATTSTTTTATPPAATEEKKEKEVVIVYRDPPSSQTHRMEGNYKYQLNAGFAGVEYVGIGATTVGLGYFLSPKSMLSLKYANQNGTNGDEATKMRSLTLGYRYFTGNSFNIMPTVYYRRSNSVHYKTAFFTGAVERSTLIYEDVGVGFRIGNEWQWDHFTLGTDWFGINAKVIQLNKEKHNGSGDFDLFSIEEDVTITMLSFYIGYTF